MLPQHRHPNGGINAAAALMPHVSLWWQQSLSQRGWWQNRAQLQHPDRHTYMWTHTHTCMHTLHKNQVRSAFHRSLWSISKSIKPTSKGRTN
jgi:hypothetical protein